MPQSILRRAAIAGATIMLGGLAFLSPAGASANSTGSYTSDPTAPVLPSMNGNGGGNATGRPDAGTVGKADDKNPPGQFPDGTDANNGYECDGNSGIGRTNPAHTGCTPPSFPV